MTIRTAAGQPDYLAGTGQESIEPDESLISLHLGGYGAPREGRFSLQWKTMTKIPAVEAIAGTEDNLFIFSEGNILKSGQPVNENGWQPMGKSSGMVSFTVSGNRLYAIDGKGSIFESSTQGRIKWKKIAESDPTARFITSTAGDLFITDGKGSLWMSEITGKAPVFAKSDMIAGVISFSSYRNKLYALTTDGHIYRKDLSSGDHRWLMAAYRNNETIREDIRQIAFAGNRIYGTGNNMVLYLGEHRTEGNLTARALAVRSGSQTVIIVNVDVCGLNDDFTGSIKKELLVKYGLPSTAVFINCSHTHFAPVSQRWLTWQEANQRPDSIFLNSEVRNGILGAIDKALSGLEPAELWFGRGKTDIGYNRSLKDHPELYDGDVDVLKIKYTNRDTESYLFMTACHPVFSTAGALHFTISANYPGVARKLVEDRTGTVNSLFLQGTAGDINPRDNGEYISGEKLANEVIGTLRKPMTRIEGMISCFLDTVKLPVTPWSKDAILAFRKENESKTGDVYAEKNIKWADLMIENYNKGTMPDQMPVYVQTINIGNWKLVGFSRETTTEYGLGVKQMWPGKLVSVAGYTNDVSSYLPTHMHLEARNYEGLDSFFWYGMANVFPMDVDTIILERIRTLAH
jgi:hypothetical protein